jgi:hypothetical protein
VNFKILDYLCYIKNCPKQTIVQRAKICPIWDRCYNFKNIFAEKFSEKIAFLSQNKAKLCKILIITLVFEKSAIFIAENCQTSPKIMIITSTPGHTENVSEETGEFVRQLSRCHRPSFCAENKVVVSGGKSER